MVPVDLAHYLIIRVRPLGVPSPLLEFLSAPRMSDAGALFGMLSDDLPSDDVGWPLKMTLG